MLGVGALGAVGAFAALLRLAKTRLPGCCLAGRWWSAGVAADFASKGPRSECVGGKLSCDAARTAGDEAVSGGSGGAGTIERGGFRISTARGLCLVKRAASLSSACWCSAMIANRALVSAGGGLARWGSGTGTGSGAKCGIAQGKHRMTTTAGGHGPSLVWVWPRWLTKCCQTTGGSGEALLKAT